MEFICSEDTMDKKVIRCRPYLEGGETDLFIIETLRQFAEENLQNFTLRGFEEIPKIQTSLALDECKKQVFNEEGKVV